MLHCHLDCGLLLVDSLIVLQPCFVGCGGAAQHDDLLALRPCCTVHPYEQIYGT